MKIYQQIKNSKILFTVTLTTLVSSSALLLGNSGVEAKGKTSVQGSIENNYSIQRNLISLKNGDKQIEYRQGGNNASIPYIVSPRYTLLLNDKPTFRWNAVKGANSYLVRVEGGEIDWQKEVNGVEVVYSGEQPLKSGVNYLFTVEADNGASSLDEDGTKLGFSLLTPEQVEQIKKAAVKINRSNTSKQEKAIALAKLYSKFELNAKAIEILETAKNNGGKTTEIYNLLGHVYAEIGLNLLAEENYSQAIKLESNGGNLTDSELENVSQIKASLAGVKIMLGKSDEADELIKQAAEGYSKLGQPDKANQLSQRLVSLKEGETMGRSTIISTISTTRGGPRKSSSQEQIEDIITPKWDDWP